MLKKSYFIILLLMTGFQSFAQTTDHEKSKPQYTISKWPSIGVGAGLLYYKGDVQNKQSSKKGGYRTGFYGFIEERFIDPIGISASYTMGKIAGSELSETRQFNFETEISQVEVNAIFHFDNNFILDRHAKVAPYISAGIGFLSFTPRGDLMLGDSTKYHYWPNGQIKDGPVTDEDAENISWDYDYETELDPKESYPHQTTTIPLTLGLKFKISGKFDMNVAGTYYMVKSDNLDNVSEGGNDNMLFTHVSLNYNIGVKRVENLHEAEQVDLASLDLSDSDGDGVIDLDDFCQGTPQDVEVDNAGCPLDDDKDGVPNYRDKEPNTEKGALVNVDGVTMTEEEMKQYYLQFVDSTGEYSNTDMKEIDASKKSSKKKYPKTQAPDYTKYQKPAKELKIERPDEPVTEKKEVSEVKEEKNIKNTATPEKVKPKETVPATETSSDIVFKVQVMAGGKDIPMSRFQGLKEMSTMPASNGLTKYLTGSFTNYDEANDYKMVARDKGYKGAYVIAIKDGKIIPVAQAIQLLKSR